MVTMGVFPFQGKTHMVEPGIEPGTSWLVVRRSDHQATRLVVINVHIPKLNLSSKHWCQTVWCKIRSTVFQYGYLIVIDYG